jgi:septal ring-binding cell division protein DamX
MTSPFTDHLARKLGVSASEGRRALDQVAAIIQTQIARDGEARIEGFGTFRRKNDGLEFEAARSLQRIVNSRYAGMPAVTAPISETDAHAQASSPPEPAAPDPTPPVAESREEGATEHEGSQVPISMPKEEIAEPMPPVDDATDEDEHDELADLLSGVWTPQMTEGENTLGPPPDRFEDADFQIVEPDAVPVAPGPHAKGGRSQVPPRAASPPPESEGSPERQKPGSGERPGRPAQGAINPRAGRPVRGRHPTSGPPGARPPTPPPTGRNGNDGPHRSRTRRRLWPLFAIALGMIAATGALVYWIFIAHPQSPTTPEPATEIAAPATEATPDDEVVADPEPVAAEPPPAPDGPLRSAEGVDPAQGGFTWAISEPSRSVAEDRAARYREQGYRVSVLPATVRGTTVYRVTIGQFSSRTEATRHRNELPADVPEDIWVLEL